MLGISFALYSMSHHVTTLIWAIFQQVHMQHRATVRVPESSMDTGSIARSVSTCDDISKLFSSGALSRSSDGDETDFEPAT